MVEKRKLLVVVDMQNDFIDGVLVKTALPEITVIVDAACCARVTPESHATALDAMGLLQVEVINRMGKCI